MRRMLRHHPIAIGAGIGVVAAVLAFAMVRDGGSSDSSAGGRAVCQHRVATIAGTDGADRLVGTGSADIIAAGDGDDRVLARGGRDLLCGGGGADLLSGGAGNDGRRASCAPCFEGGLPNEGIFGGDGPDTMRGGSGDDDLFGDDGVDRLSGGSDTDLCVGQGPRHDTGSHGDLADSTCDRTQGVARRGGP